MDKQMITLPLPPTTNHTYLTTKYKHGTYKSKEAKDWENLAGYELIPYRPKKPLLGALYCQIDLFLKRDRDVDGSNKLVLDLLQAMRFYENDSQITHLNIRKFVDKTNPRMEIDIKSLQE